MPFLFLPIYLKKRKSKIKRYETSYIQYILLRKWNIVTIKQFISHRMYIFISLPSFMLLCTSTINMSHWKRGQTAWKWFLHFWKALRREKEHVESELYKCHTEKNPILYIQYVINKRNKKEAKTSKVLLTLAHFWWS